MRTVSRRLGAVLLFATSAAPLIYVGALLNAIRNAMA